jgi:hypothetical protein
MDYKVTEKSRKLIKYQLSGFKVNLHVPDLGTPQNMNVRRAHGAFLNSGCLVAAGLLK